MPAWEDDILCSERFEKAKTITHHHKTNLAAHSRHTAEHAKRICRWLKRRGIEISEEDVVRACLLHDIGMTDDDVSESGSWRKAYLHPRRSELIARYEYNANEIQCNAIRRHMWPVCVILPKHLEGWVVVAADKYSSIIEITRRQTTRNN